MKSTKMKEYIQGAITAMQNPIKTYRIYKAGSKLIEKKKFLQKAYGKEKGTEIWEQLSLNPSLGKEPDYRSIEHIIFNTK